MKANWSVAMLFCLGVAFLLSTGSSIMAQGEDPASCIHCYCKATTSCNTSGSECLSNPCQGVPFPCAIRQFTADCGAQWHVRAVLSCTYSPACGRCKACAYLCDGTTVIASVSTECNESDCISDSEPIVTLTGGHTYSLAVCLMSCGGSCPDCSTCTARAFVFTGGSLNDVCTVICNP